MKLVENLNLYFGTEHETVGQFIKDFKKGDLSDDYETHEEALNHLLMFLNSYSQQ